MIKGLMVFSVVIFLVVIGGVSGFIYYNHINNTEIKNVVNSNNVIVDSNPVIVTKDSLPKYLEGQKFINDLPNNAVIEFRLYNFNSGEREWEESYSIKKGSVKETNDNIKDADMVIMVHSKYVPELGKGFCSTIQKAKANGDFGVEIKLSESELLWKYKNLLSQKSCLGL
ncbi:MAG: hypothetical protein AABX03_02060 [Nanoarchaeota archaeon]